MRDFFYKPQGAWAADFIPFYHNGAYHLFYLLDWRDVPNHGEGTPWYQVSTRDFVNFTEHGEMLGRGSQTEQDLYVFTGSVVEGEGKFHIFYTGHNPHLRQQGKPEQGVMHAVSDDLLHWQKVTEDTFFSPRDRFEPHDWRDPFVFWNPEANEYWMLLAARLKDGPSRRRGCTELCASKDLKHWEVRDPLYAPALFFTHECPDLFKMGDWWYLVFSEFTDACMTRYRMSRSLQGPWLTPVNDTFDGHCLYAAKTASDGQKRYLFGWNATKTDEKDEGNWQWGGNLAVHELYQLPDGTLAVRVPDSVEQALGSPLPLKPGRDVDAPGTFRWLSMGEMPARGKINARLTFSKGTRGCGIYLRGSEDGETAYYLRLEPNQQRLVFDYWPRPGDKPFAPELERPLELIPGQPVDFKVLFDGIVCEVYVNDKIAMSLRLYNLKSGQWGVFAQDGHLTIL